MNESHDLCIEGNMNAIYSVLPEGWEAKARETKAFSRRGDYLETPADLLQMILLWADLGTFGSTSSFMKTTEVFPMSKVAVYHRVRKSAKWLEWLAVNICRENGYLAKEPEWLKVYRVLLVDASKVSRPGSANASDTLHAMIELFSLSMIEEHLTSASVGESMTNFHSLQKNDLTVADRIYGTIKSMLWVEQHEAYYVFRMKAESFNLYQRSKSGKMILFNLTKKLSKKHKEGKILSYELFYRVGEEYHPVRVCVKRKKKQDIEKGIRHIKSSNNGKNRGKVTELQKIYNKYIVVVSNLPTEATAEQILELYRMRWQIELVFKRLKSIIKYDEIQTRTETTSKAWLHCKLLMAAICEIYVQRSSFSPSERKTDEQIAEIIMAGIKSDLRWNHIPDP